MTLRTKLAAFHARIHSHRHTACSSHFHLKPASGKDHPPQEGAPPSPSRHHASKSKRSDRSSLSSSSTSSNHSSEGRHPSPVLTLMVPTGSHDLNVEARIYHPAEFPADYGRDARARRKAAVVAHPYASLGGSWDDPVVLALVGVLTGRGWIVATFNFGHVVIS
ncbi:hypothetical protein DRE_06737 [Drechslerella stenobrocha 248]|uniref:Uncharacterized protein n=1 Tax=Drechslerella stenobrocha 248 TaxID=1043628 RepID=W7HN03_9PEZI|nr:hypothetical protein DRE_06737 [Drechslerella stenobrocha 248]